MSEVYTRRATACLKKESTANTAVTPDTFFYLNSEDIASDFPHTPTMAVAGVRSKNIGVVRQKIPAPVGTITVNVEPNTFGHFLNGLFGGLTTGRYFTISSIVGSGFTVGETITGGASSNTATVAYVGKDFLLVTSPSGDLTDGETITGGGSSTTATVGDYEATVYGHAAKAPANISDTYTLQINLSESAIRYFGVRFTGIDALGQEDNVITAGVKVMAQSIFRHAVVASAVSSGAGSKTITVDQTAGLVASDSIKVFRPSTGQFLDFSAASTDTHSIDSVASTTTFSVTNLETSLAAGDLIMLAPLTATYSVADEMPWVGGGQISIGDDVDSLVAQAVEEFSLVVDNEFEERHAGQGTDFETLMPSAVLQKGVVASGNFSFHYVNETFMSKLRSKAEGALKIVVDGSEIGATAVKNRLHMQMPRIVQMQYNTNVDVDSLIQEEVPFEAFHDSDEGYLAEVLLVNNVTGY